MRIRSLFAGALLVGVAATSGSAFSHQTQGTDPTDPVVKCGKNVQVIPAPDQTIYIDVRDVLGGQAPPVGHNGAYDWSLWIYVEGNNHPGLQTKAGDDNGILGDLQEAGLSSIENCSTSLNGHTSVTKADSLVF